MKKRVPILFTTILLLTMSSILLCSCGESQSSTTSSSMSSSSSLSSYPDQTMYKVFAIVNGNEAAKTELVLTSNTNPDIKTEHTVTLNLEKNDSVVIKDTDDVEFNNFENPTEFDGIAKFDGEYTFHAKHYIDDRLALWVEVPSNPDPTPDPDPVTNMYLKSPNGVVEMQADGNERYSAKVILSVGDGVEIYDNNGTMYQNYAGDFNGKAKIAGEHTFIITLGESNMITVIEPQHPIIPHDTKTTVYYTNSKGWSNVYAYLWNYSSNKQKVAWPGEKLSVIGTSGYGEKQYCIEVDYSQYDRIIFNNGSGGAGNQTKDLVVSQAVSGYYGEDGIFTMDTENYGNVQYVTLKDTKNLNYIANNSKKISIYTPADYSKDKKYGVLYMFDSQNLYIAANGAQTMNNPWAVDVAVTNMVKNGSEGVIIVAIDNTDGHRDSELTMSQSFGTLTSLADNQAFYNGKLDELGNFIKETVMPYISAHYSVDTSREKTGIAGSSSGGLAAYYLGLRDNHLYSYIGAFSPANGLFENKDWIRFYSNKDFGNNRPKIYVYCGVNDGGLEDMLAPAAKHIKDLTSYGFSADSIIENYVSGATHNETYWRIAFMDFLGKMLG